MKVKEVWRKIEEHRKIKEQISKINQRITQLKNVAYSESSQVIDLATGMAEINLESEMKKEYCAKKLKQLRKRKSELIARQRDVEAELQKDYEKLKRDYEKGLVKMQLYFQKFLRQLKSLRMVWNLMNEDGNDLANVSRTLWRLRGILGINEVLKEMPPFHRWKQDLERCFTLLENYEKEAEKHGDK